MCKIKYKKTGWYIPGSWVPVREIVSVQRCPSIPCTTVPLTKVTDMLFRTELQRHQNKRYPFLERPAKAGRRTRRTAYMKFKFELESIMTPELPTPELLTLEPESIVLALEHKKQGSLRRRQEVPESELWSDEDCIDYFKKAWSTNHRSEDIDFPVSLLCYSGLGELNGH